MGSSEGGAPGNPEAHSHKSWNPVAYPILIFYGVSASYDEVLLFWQKGLGCRDEPRHSFEKREDGCPIKNVGHDEREGRFLPTAPRYDEWGAGYWTA